MKKKQFAVLALSLALLLAFSACGNKDGKDDTPGKVSSPTDIELPEATPTPQPQPVNTLTICGIPVVMNGQPTGVGYKGAAYSEGVLTLTDVDMRSDYGSYPAIEFEGNLQIVLVGENQIATENGVSAISGTGENTSLTISGEGSATVKASGDSGYGLFCTGTVTVKGGEAAISGTEGAVSGYAGSGDQLVFADGYGIVSSDDTSVVLGAVS